MMEATFGLTALCDTENNGLLFPSSVFALDADDDWSKDGCATETNPLLLLLLPDDDDDDDDAPSLDLDPNMLAYLAARETVVFGDDDDDAFGTVDDKALEYTDRAEDVRSERNDDDWCCCCGLKYFCAVGESERIERDVVIGTYFCDFCAGAAAPPPTAGDDDDDGDDKDRRVSSLASFRSFSASTSTVLMLFFDDDEEASFSSSSSNNAFPFTTVFPDFKDVFKSSREGSSSTFTRASSSAVFTAEDKSTTSFFPSLSSKASVVDALLSSTGTFDVSFSPMEEEEEAASL